MSAEFSGTYQDRNGREIIVIESDGRRMRTNIRGVIFEGVSFDDFSLAPESSSGQRAIAGENFRFNGDTLCDCRIRIRIPVTVFRGETSVAINASDAWLSVDLMLGVPADHGGIDGLELRLRLYHTGLSGLRKKMYSSGRVDSFEDGLQKIQAELSPGHSLRLCFTCALSDYWPGGAALFGGLACFRNIPELYERVTDKQSLLKIFERHDGFVQETHVCSEFRPRAPGRGYRG